jgi:hypothetical protein
MLCMEFIVICSKIYKQYVNTLCGMNTEFFTVKPGNKLRHN